MAVLNRWQLLARAPNLLHQFRVIRAVAQPAAPIELGLVEAEGVHYRNVADICIANRP